MVRMLYKHLCCSLRNSSALRTLKPTAQYPSLFEYYSLLSGIPGHFMLLKCLFTMLTKSATGARPCHEP